MQVASASERWAFSMETARRRAAATPHGTKGVQRACGESGNSIFWGTTDGLGRTRGCTS